MTVTEEHGGLSVGNDAVVQLRGARDQEQLIAVDIDLRQLAVFERVFYREWVKLVEGL